MVSGDGVTVAGYSARIDTQIVCPFIIATGATPGARTVTVTNPTGGASATGIFTIGAPPTFISIVPASGKHGGTYPVTITGTNFEVGASTVSVSGTGVTVAGYSARTDTQIICPFIIESRATQGARIVTVTNPSSGATAVGTFTIGTGPIITGISPSSGQNGGTFTITITGTNFEAKKSTVTVSGTGVTVGTYKARTANTIIVPFTIAAKAAKGVRTVTVRNPTTGGTATGKFTVAAGPTISKISPASGQRGKKYMVTITGPNFDAKKSTVTVSGTGVTVGVYKTRTTKKIIVPFTITAKAAKGVRTVTVRNPIKGGSVTGKFTVKGISSTNEAETGSWSGIVVIPQGSVPSFVVPKQGRSLTVGVLVPANDLIRNPKPSSF